MRRLHLVVGIATALAFLASGAYMRSLGHARLAAVPDREMLFASRHIYLLAPALVNLTLGAYVRLGARAWARRLQWLGTSLLVASAALLVTAFVVEPVRGGGRTRVSAYGVYLVVAGSLLHAIAARSAGTSQ